MDIVGFARSKLSGAVDRDFENRKRPRRVELETEALYVRCIGIAVH